MGYLRKTGLKTVLLMILVYLIMIDTTTSIPDEVGVYITRIIDLLLSSVKNALETMICLFLMEKVTPEMEFLRKNDSKTLFLTILMCLIIIDTTKALTYSWK